MVDIPQAADSPPSSLSPSGADIDPAPASSLGLIGLLLSILGVVSCGFLLFSLPGLIVSIIATRRGRSAKAKAGVVLGGIGVVEFVVVVFLLMQPDLAAAQHAARVKTDADQIMRIHEAMMLFSENDRDGYLPKPGRINRFTHPESPHHEDPWGNQYRIEHRTDGADGTGGFVVKSDGPDGIPNTEDDQVHPPG
jgi:hypothetical protein